MYKKILTLFTSAFIFLNSQAQEVVVHSKKSDQIAAKLTELVDSISQADIIKSYSLDSFNILTAASQALSNKEHEFSEEFTIALNELVTKLNEEFNSQGPKIPKDVKGTEVPKLSETTLSKLKELMNNLLKKETLSINADLKILNIEANANNELLTKIKAATVTNLDALTKGILSTWKKNDEAAITSTTGVAFEGIKKLAHKTTLKNGEESFPIPDKKTLEINAAKIYRLYKVGDHIKFTHGPTPAIRREVDAKIKTITSTRVLFQFAKVRIEDIKDKLIRDGLQPNKTRANRDKWIKDQLTIIRKKRNRFYIDNLQLTASKLIADNEAQGYILVSGKWQAVSDVVKAKISAKLSTWKVSNEVTLEKAHLADRNLINVFNEYITPFSEALNKTYAEAESKFKEDTRNILNQVSANNDNSETSEEDLIKMQQERDEKTRLEKEAIQKLAREKRKENLALNKRNGEIEAEDAKAKAETEKNKWMLVGVVIFLIIASAAALFNPKIRAKIIGSGGKKKNMQDIVSSLQAPGTPAPDQLPPGVSPPPRTATTAMAKEEPAPTPDKTQINLDGAINIDRGGEEDVAQAAPRKKISLNLGSSSVALSDPNSGGLKPPSGGLKPPIALKPPGAGLTPPGGGLKPPGAGLTPPGGLKAPGGNSDESENPE
jgi:hypothetical protein